jgi:hypothetical protein
MLIDKPLGLYAKCAIQFSLIEQTISDICVCYAYCLAKGGAGLNCAQSLKLST